MTTTRLAAISIELARFPESAGSVLAYNHLTPTMCAAVQEDLRAWLDGDRAAHGRVGQRVHHLPQLAQGRVLSRSA